MCGIVGIVDAGGVSLPLYYALYALQHRGQESAGISVFDGERLRKHKGPGLVAEVFDTEILRGLHGTVGVGHVRYPTTGANLPENFQPFNFQFLGRSFALAHNGNLVNTRELRAAYEQAGQIFCTTTDTEVIANLIADELRRSGSIEDAVRKLHGPPSGLLLGRDGLRGPALRVPRPARPQAALHRDDAGRVYRRVRVGRDRRALGHAAPRRRAGRARADRCGRDHLDPDRPCRPGRALHLRIRLLRARRLDHRRGPGLRRAAADRADALRGGPGGGGLGLPDPGLGYGLRDRLLQGLGHSVPRRADEEPVHGPDLHHAHAGCARAGRADQAEPDQEAPRGEVDRAGRRLDRARHDLAADRPAGPRLRRPRDPPAGRLAADQGAVLSWAWTCRPARN